MASWRVGVDVGGTFTDLVAVDRESGERLHLKVSTTPDNPARGFLEAIAALRERAGAGAGEVELIFHGTTLATNAIIERKIARTALVTTEGFRDVLEIGRHWRSDLYDLDLERPDPLVPRRLRFEVAERIGADGAVATALDDDAIDAALAALEGADVESVGVVFLHSYANPDHEERFIERLREASQGRWYVCASSEVGREPREFERTSTTVLNAALMPLIDAYLSDLERELADDGRSPRLYITHSNGGALSPEAARRRPVGLAQSGPVAGVHSCVELGAALGHPNIIGFDMGGTSADIALIEDGQPRLSTELDVGGLPVRLPAVEVYSIGAGGGSIAWLDEVGALRVGPMSAGASPGPACYGRGGARPTVTDCNLLLGRLPATRPLAGFLTLDEAAARAAVEQQIATPLGLTVEEAAQGVLDVVNAEMEGAVRVVLRERGNDPRDFALVAFGGAGALHAVELASRLGVGTVIVPAHPGTFSAQGLLTSDLRQDFAVSSPIRSDDADAAARLREAYDELERLAAAQLETDPDFAHGVSRERRCDIRYVGQAYEVGVDLGDGPLDDDAVARLLADFHAQHERMYAFADENAVCEIRVQRLFLTAPVGEAVKAPPPPATKNGAMHATEAGAVLFGGRRLSCPLVDREGLRPGAEIPAPCVIAQDNSTTFVPPDVSVDVAPTGDLLITGIPAS
jgi:N-methylhydantoinase A